MRGVRVGRVKVSESDLWGFGLMRLRRTNEETRRSSPKPETQNQLAKGGSAHADMRNLRLFKLFLCSGLSPHSGFLHLIAERERNTTLAFNGRYGYAPIERLKDRVF